MVEKLDYKKEYKDLYLPKTKPMLIQVPTMNFIMVDGTGDPNGSEYKDAIQTLYALTFTIKMSKMGPTKLDGYFEYVVPPLEGLWYSKNPNGFNIQDRDSWLWISMIRQPEFVTKEVFDWAVNECKIKKPEIDISKARFESLDEGLCVQIMHIGPYSKEPSSINKMDQFIQDNGFKNVTSNDRKHHEIYLSDPRKTNLEKLKTVLRIPVEKV